MEGSDLISNHYLLYIEAFDNAADKNLLFLRRKINVLRVTTLEEATEKIVGSTDIGIVLMRYNVFPSEDFVFFVKKVKKVNPMIKIAVYEATEKWIETHNETLETNNVIVMESGISEENLMMAVDDFLNMPVSERRRFNRVDWPLKMLVREKYPDELLNVMSVSGGGALVKKEDRLPKQGERFHINLFFKDFKLLTEAEVVRVNEERSEHVPVGFAVKFLNVSKGSQKVIDEIVRDKLIKSILFEYSHHVGYDEKQ